MNAHTLTAARIEDRHRHREATFTNLATSLRAATTHAERRQALALAAVTLAAIEPLHNRAVAHCAVTVRRPEAGGTGVTVTVARETPAERLVRLAVERDERVREQAATIARLEREAGIR